MSPDEAAAALGSRGETQPIAAAYSYADRALRDAIAAREAAQEREAAARRSLDKSAAAAQHAVRAASSTEVAAAPTVVDAVKAFARKHNEEVDAAIGLVGRFRDPIAVAAVRALAIDDDELAAMIAVNTCAAWALEKLPAEAVAKAEAAIQKAGVAPSQASSAAANAAGKAQKDVEEKSVEDTGGGGTPSSTTSSAAPEASATLASGHDHNH